MAGLGGCADGARVEDVGTAVGAEVDAGEHDVGALVQQGGEGELHAVGGRAVDAEAVEVRFVELDRPQGLEDREGVADARLLAHGGDHVDLVAALHERPVQGAQAGSADAVVVGDEYVHKVLAVGRRCRPQGLAATHGRRWACRGAEAVEQLTSALKQGNLHLGLQEGRTKA